MNEGGRNFRKVLIAVDEDPIAAHAADVGIDLARSLGAEIALVHAMDATQVYSVEPGMAADERAQILAAEHDGTRLMAEFRARLPAGAQALQFVPQGDPGPEIVRVATEWQADLVVIGSHGRRGITRALVGSVADWVMRHAPCPVVVVRTKS
ncbi:MAG: universal stress protein [Reyranella sp.]|uniref:universal stress protein n=1 Tax=Reyranella sp. TaxID=1929291 RepID=UPI003D10CC41